MNAATSLESMGLTLGLSSDGNLIVDGLKHLDHEQKAHAVTIAKEHKAAIVEDVLHRLLQKTSVDDPTPEQLTHARRLLVVCPSMPKGCSVHCWYCSRCKKASACKAWRHLRSHVEFFRQSGIPYSALVIEATEGKKVLQ